LGYQIANPYPHNDKKMAAPRGRVTREAQPLRECVGWGRTVGVVASTDCHGLSIKPAKEGNPGFIVVSLGGPLIISPSDNQFFHILT
jgi:hypothetical protein